MRGVRKCVVLLSGGMDSAALLALASGDGKESVALSVRYGQRHSRELSAAARLAALYSAPHSVVDCQLPACPMTGAGTLPPWGGPGGPGSAATVVPGRNAVLLSLGAAHAAACGAGEVWIGANAGDAAVYPDCRPGFIKSMSDALSAAYGVTAEAPLLMMPKRDVASLAASLGVPVGQTWSCYEGGDSPCGDCGACLCRAEALGVPG